jgi:hypothetical protein
MNSDTDAGTAPEAAGTPKKAPRKPRPSEIAAKKAKAAKAKAAKSKAKRKPAPKKKAAKSKAAKSKKPAKRKAAKSKPKRKSNGRPLVRTERLDMRITKEEKRRLEAKAKRLQRTVTSVALEAIMKMR